MDDTSSYFPPYTPFTVDTFFPCTDCLSKFDRLSNPPISAFSQSISSRIRDGFNLSISPGDTTKIEGFLAEASGNITEYNKSIAEMERLLNSLKSARDDLQCRSDSARYLISAPIRKLPLDVLNEIFMFYCNVDTPEYNGDGENDFGQPIFKTVYSLTMIPDKPISFPTMKLSWVCSFWRTFVESHPNLWSSMRLSAKVLHSKPGSFPILLKYLSHARNSLLDFSFNVEAESLWSNSKVRETNELLLGSSMRWRRADLSYLPREWLSHATASLNARTFLEPDRAQSGSFPALKCLNITFNQWSNETSVFFQRLAPCPQLRAVDLTSLSWSGLQSTYFAYITDLKLRSFIGKSFGHLLRRLPKLETLTVYRLDVSEDNDGWPQEMAYYSSSLAKLNIYSATFTPAVWGFARLPCLTDMTLVVGECQTFSLQTLQVLSLVLCDQCQLKNLQLRVLEGYEDIPQTLFDFIALPTSLVHLTVYSRTMDPFLQLLLPKADGSCIARNLRSLTFIYIIPQYQWYHEIQSQGPIICELVESRCTVLQTPAGNPEISGLQALTLQSAGGSDHHSQSTLANFVHTRLSPLKEAGLKLDGYLLR